MTRPRWNSGDRWGRAAGCVCPDRAAGDWSFLSAEPWKRPRTYERAAGYPSRAAGGAESYEAVRRAICSLPGWTPLSRVGRDALSAGNAAQLTAWAMLAYGSARAASFGLLPAVSTRQVGAVFDGLEGLFSVCAPRAGGLRGDSLRALATAIEIVGSPVAAVPLYGVAAAVGGSGLLVEVVGVAVTGWIGGAMAAVVAICEVLLATGIPLQLRRVARELDAEEAASIPDIPPPTIDPIFGLLPGTIGTWEGPIKTPPSSTTATGGGGAAIAGVAGIGLGLFLLKGLL